MSNLGNYLHVNINTGFSVTFDFRMSLLTMGWKIRTPSEKHISIASITQIKENQSPNQRWELHPLFPLTVCSFSWYLHKTTLAVYYVILCCCLWFQVSRLLLDSFSDEMFRVYWKNNENLQGEEREEKEKEIKETFKKWCKDNGLEVQLYSILLHWLALL